MAFAARILNVSLCFLLWLSIVKTQTVPLSNCFPFIHSNLIHEKQFFEFLPEISTFQTVLNVIRNCWSLQKSSRHDQVLNSLQSNVCSWGFKNRKREKKQKQLSSSCFGCHVLARLSTTTLDGEWYCFSTLLHPAKKYFNFVTIDHKWKGHKLN